jgi:hypothetical protein
MSTRLPRMKHYKLAHLVLHISLLLTCNRLSIVQEGESVVNNMFMCIAESALQVVDQDLIPRGKRRFLKPWIRSYALQELHRFGTL